METFGERLKRLRRAKGINQPELAKKAGVTKAAVSALENSDAAEPRSSTLIALASILSVSPTYLMTGRGEPDAEFPWENLSETARLAAVAMDRHLTDEQKAKVLRDIEENKRANEAVLKQLGSGT